MLLILSILFWASWAAIVYTYVLFPLILALCVRLAGAKNTAVDLTEEDLPHVTMVIAAYNEEQVIAAKLANTWEIDYPAARFKIIVGSDGSDDGTSGILKRCIDSRLRAFIFPDRRGKISVLNDLMRQVDSDIVVMSDANTMYAPDAIRKMVRHFQDPKVGCVSGKLQLEQNGGVSGEGIYWKYEGWIKRNESCLGFLIGCNGGIFATRPHLYEPLPPTTIVEDFVLSMRIIERGYLVRFEPDAHASEPPCSTASAEMTRKVRIGAGGFQALGLTRSLLHPRHGIRAFAYMGHKVIRWCVPFFITASLLTSAILAVQSSLYLALLALQGLGALLSIIAYRVPAGVTLPRLIRPITYFYLMNYALFCGFFRYVFNTQKVTWDRAPQASPISSEWVSHGTAVSSRMSVLSSSAAPAGVLNAASRSVETKESLID